MATQNDFIISRFPPSAALSAFRRVTVNSSGQLAYTAVDKLGIGTLQEDCTANSYERPAVRLYGTGTFKVIVTGGAVTIGDVVVAVTNGAVSVTNGLVGNTGVTVGIALESANGASAAGSDGSVIEVAPLRTA